MLAYLYNWSYPCYAGNLERWRCPAPQHWLPVHWSGVSCECVPRLNLIGGKKYEYINSIYKSKSQPFHTQIQNKWLYTGDCAHALQECLKINKRDLKQAPCRSHKSLTSSELFKHQVELVFLFKELHQLQDVTLEKGKQTLWAFGLTDF